MTAPDRSIEDAALIAFVRERLAEAMTASVPILYVEQSRRMFTALLSRLEGRGSGTAQAETLIETIVKHQAAVPLANHVKAWKVGANWAFDIVRAALASSPASVAAEPDGGLWAKMDPRRIFVMGAKWWQFHANKATAFSSEVDEMEAEAERRYGPASVATGAAADVRTRLMVKIAIIETGVLFQACTILPLLHEIAESLASPAPLPDASNSREALEELKALADDSLRVGGQRVGVPMFVPSVAKRVLEIVTKGLAAPLPDAAPVAFDAVEAETQIAAMQAYSDRGGRLNVFDWRVLRKAVGLPVGSVFPSSSPAAKEKP